MIERWTQRLEVKPVNTSDEIEDAMQAEIDELRARVAELEASQFKTEQHALEQYMKLRKKDALLAQALEALKFAVAYGSFEQGSGMVRQISAAITAIEQGTKQ